MLFLLFLDTTHKYALREVIDGQKCVQMKNVY